MNDGASPVDIRRVLMANKEEPNDIFDRIRKTRIVGRWELLGLRAWQKVERRLGRVFVVNLLIRTFEEMTTDDSTHMAAGVAYYAFLSLFPLLLGATVILSFFVDAENVESSISTFSDQYIPGSTDLVVTNIEAVLRLRGAFGVLAILGLLWSGSAIFGAVNRAVNRAWDVRRDRPLYIGKPRQLLMALAFGGLFLLSLSAASAARLASELTGLGDLYDQFSRFVLQGISLALTFAIFLLIYKFMPNTKTYWRYIWSGALVAAILFEIAKTVFIVYLDEFANFENVYGSLAPVLGLLLWAYISSLILIFGAELAAEFGRLIRGVDRGMLIQPTKYSLRKDDDHRLHYGLDINLGRRRRPKK
jgi:membrane protein